MFTRDQRIYSVISNRAGTFFSYSATGKSGWVRLDGDISITDQRIEYLSAADADGNCIQRLRREATINGVPYEQAYDLAVISASVNL